MQDIGNNYVRNQTTPRTLFNEQFGGTDPVSFLNFYLL